MSQSRINSRDPLAVRYSIRSATDTRNPNAFASRAPYSESANILPIDTSTQAGVQSSLDLSIVTPTQPPHASDRDNSPVHDNPAIFHPLSVICKKPRVPVRITTASNWSRLPFSRARSEESDIMIAARSFRNSLGDNSLDENSVRSVCLFCCVITLRARRTTLLTESHAWCVHNDYHAPFANSTAGDRHSLLCCVHSSAPKAVPREHVRNLLR